MIAITMYGFVAAVCFLAAAILRLPLREAPQGTPGGNNDAELDALIAGWEAELVADLRRRQFRLVGGGPGK
jgi:hypothetical protein